MFVLCVVSKNRKVKCRIIVWIKYKLNTSEHKKEIQLRARFSAPVLTLPGAHPASYTMSRGVFPVGQFGQGVELTTPPHLLLRLKKH
jgi:hypothetical protein